MKDKQNENFYPDSGANASEKHISCEPRDSTHKVHLHCKRKPSIILTFQCFVGTLHSKKLPPNMMKKQNKKIHLWSLFFLNGSRNCTDFCNINACS